MIIIKKETFIFYFDFSTLDSGNESHKKAGKGQG